MVTMKISRGMAVGFMDALLNDQHSDVRVRHLLRLARVFRLKSPSREGKMRK